MALDYIKKRDGSIVAFDQEKIFKAIWKAVEAVGGQDSETARFITKWFLLSKLFLKMIF